MTPIAYLTRKFVVLHGHANTARPTLLTYDPPAKISTGQPNVEPFDDPQAAIDRAIELGVPPLLTQELWPYDHALNITTGKLVALPDPIPAWDADTSYAPGSVVRCAVNMGDADEPELVEMLFLKISDAHPSVPDMVFDLEAGTGDWAIFNLKPAPAPPPEPTAEERRIAALEARLAALEAA